MAKNIYDAVIIGNTLESLLVARALLESQKSILIIDQADAPVESIFEDHIHNFSSADLALSFQMDGTEIQKEIQTFESAKWQPFLGFGNQAPSFLEALAPYLKNSKYRWKSSYSQWTAQLTASLQEHILYKAKITGFEVNEDKILSVTINDSKKIQATAFIFSAHNESLVDWFQPDHIGKKNFQKLAKTSYWTRLELNIKHQEQEVSLEKDHLLSGSTENAIPLFGSFYRNPEGFLCSQWLSFLPAELTEDSEEAGNVLREMKRQIKRAYPTAFEGLIFEKIKVVPYAEASLQIELNGNCTLGNLSNAFMASGQWTGIAGIDGKISQAKMTLGFVEELLAFANPSLSQD